MTATPALSPDGKLLAYGSDRGDGRNLDIWVQRLGSEPIRRTSHPARRILSQDPPDDANIVLSGK